MEWLRIWLKMVLPKNSRRKVTTLDWWPGLGTRNIDTDHISNSFNEQRIKKITSIMDMEVNFEYQKKKRSTCHADTVLAITNRKNIKRMKKDHQSVPTATDLMNLIIEVARCFRLTRTQGSQSQAPSTGNIQSNPLNELLSVIDGLKDLLRRTILILCGCPFA
ncbi:hypothetical protein JTB14_038419 [Gonioctena quinquepunctata]|nr:hypothetical protein JTB14_038419 [Gonioctena quinquepunctata]